MCNTCHKWGCPIDLVSRSIIGVTACTDRRSRKSAVHSKTYRHSGQQLDRQRPNDPDLRTDWGQNATGPAYIASKMTCIASRMKRGKSALRVMKRKWAGWLEPTELCPSCPVATSCRKVRPCKTTVLTLLTTRIGTNRQATPITVPR